MVKIFKRKNKFGAGMKIQFSSGKIFCFSCLVSIFYSCQTKTTVTENKREMVVFSESESERSKSLELETIPNDTLLNNSEFEKTLLLIKNTSPYSGKRENVQYGLLCEKVYSLIYESDNIGVNRKIDLLLAFAFYQEKYIPAYWSLLLVKIKNGKQEVRDSLTYLLPMTVFNNAPLLFITELKENRSKIHPPIAYLSFFENTTRIIITSKISFTQKEIAEYDDLLRTQIFSESYMNKYSKVGKKYLLLAG